MYQGDPFLEARYELVLGDTDAGGLTAEAAAAEVVAAATQAPAAGFDCLYLSAYMSWASPPQGSLPCS